MPRTAVVRHTLETYQMMFQDLGRDFPPEKLDDPPLPSSRDITRCMQINRLNGDKHNNCPDKLELVTPARNSKHAARVLGLNRGRRNGLAKLTEEQVRRIRRLCNQDELTRRQIAKRRGIHESNVSYIASRKTWRHVA